MTFPFIGSISHATLKTEDLIEVFTTVLQQLDPEFKPKEFLDEEYLNDLFDALDELAPEYLYFGSHQGDASDFGFWLSWDAIDEAVCCKECLRVSDLAEIPSNWTKDVILTNDHGNVTIYKPVIAWEEVASYV